MAKVGIGGVGTDGSYNIDGEDQKMSVQHRQDSLEYNFRHAEDHLNKAKDIVDKLHAAGADHKIPKSTLDLMSYFKDASGHTTHAEAKLKNIAKSHFNAK